MHNRDDSSAFSVRRIAGKVAHSLMNVILLKVFSQSILETMPHAYIRCRINARKGGMGYTMSLVLTKLRAGNRCIRATCFHTTW